MRGRSTRSGVALVAALALTATGLTGLVGPAPAGAQGNAVVAWDPAEPTPLTVPGMAVPLERAGELGLWGDDAYGQSTVPASLQGVAIKQVVKPDGRSTLALTAAGQVFGWGKNPDKVEQIPAEVAAAKVVQITAGSYASGYAGAVTEDGRVFVWGKKRSTANPTQVPAGLTGVKQLVIGAFSAGAVKADGSVVTWGLLKSIAEPEENSATPPAGLTATAIATNGVNSWVALTPAGSLVAWGAPMGSLPAAVEVPGSVKAIVGTSIEFLVLLADNTLMVLNGTSPPAEFLATDTVLLASGPATYEFAVVDRDRKLHYWRWSSTDVVPETWDGLDLAQIAIGHSAASTQGDPTVPVGGVIVTKMLRAELPQVSGTPVVGGTLTATPGTFSASPDAVTGQWLADGVEIAGETGPTLSLTATMSHRMISYRSTASKTGQTTQSSTSEPVPFAGASAVAMSVAKGTYGYAAAVTISVPGATGNVSLTVDGKPVGTKALVVGKASFSTVRTTTPGNHAVKATYAGSPTYLANSANGTLSVAKGRTGVPVLRVAKASPKKAGTVTVTVTTPAGLVKATGKAQLVLKKGRTTKKVMLTVKNGKAVGKLPKLPKGTWTATVTYQGNTYYLAAKSRAVKVKSK